MFELTMTVLPLLLTLNAIADIAIGLRVLPSRRPLVVSQRLFFALLLLAWLPAVGGSAWFALNGPGDGWQRGVHMVPALALACALVFLWIQMRGYMVIGVTDE